MLQLKVQPANVVAIREILATKKPNNMYVGDSLSLAMLVPFLKFCDKKLERPNAAIHDIVDDGILAFGLAMTVKISKVYIPDDTFVRENDEDWRPAMRQIKDLIQALSECVDTVVQALKDAGTQLAETHGGGRCPLEHRRFDCVGHKCNGCCAFETIP